MHKLKLSSVSLSFSAATIRVPANGAAYDFMNTEWHDEVQEIEITQEQGWTLIKGLTGYGSEISQNRIEEISPSLSNTAEINVFLKNIALERGNKSSAIESAIEVKNFPWGELVSLSWSKLGHAPGGVESIILPKISKAIYVGFVQLNWNTLAVENV